MKIKKRRKTAEKITEKRQILLGTDGKEKTEETAEEKRKKDKKGRKRLCTISSATGSQKSVRYFLVRKGKEKMEGEQQPK